MFSLKFLDGCFVNAMMYSKEMFGLMVLLWGCGGVLSRPVDAEGGSCGAQSSDLPGDSQGADLDEYSALDDDGGAQEAESCADPKAQADKGERKDAGEDKKEAETSGGEKFQESELEGESGVDKRESRYQLNDYPSCESKAVYDDEDVAKYRDAFGGFPQESGRGKRVKRSFFYH